ncbi:hypothetical protein ACA910_020622 [Epithemia clementina (nom. ined.)]
MSSQIRAVTFLGPLGHGKSRLLNKVCGTNHASNSAASSCTRTLEFGLNKKYNLFVIGTPGFGSSENVAEHLAAQKLSLEGTKLSGVYAVIKYDCRSDNVAQKVEVIMDFLGSDDLRVIVTHVDTANFQDGFDTGAFISSIANNVDIPPEHICVVGKETDGNEIAAFIDSTLHEPREFEITPTQLASVSWLSGIRKYNKPINNVIAKLQAATDACHKIVEEEKTYETDVAIIATQNSARNMVKIAKDNIFREAYENMVSDAQKNLVYGKAGVSLSLKLQQFIKTTNKLLSWDVTDPRDPKNMYRKCLYCDAVYVKVEGCVNVYSCGAPSHVPDGEEQKQASAIEAEFIEVDDKILVQYLIDGGYYYARHIKEKLLQYTKILARRAREEQKMQDKFDQAQKNGTRELNIFCFKQVSWEEMHPVSPEQLQELGEVEFETEGELEGLSRQLFDYSLRTHQTRNQELLENQKATLASTM